MRTVSRLLLGVDINKAISILQSDGYTFANGKMTRDGKPLTLALLGSPDLEQAGPEYVFEQMTKIGITVTFTNVDRATFVSNLFRGNFDVVPSGNSSTMPDPGYAIRYYTGPGTPGGQNYAHISDAAVDAEARIALASAGSDRCTHWANVQRLLLQKHEILPLAAPKYFWFGRKTDFVVIFQLIEPYSLHRIA